MSVMWTSAANGKDDTMGVQLGEDWEHLTDTVAADARSLRYEAEDMCGLPATETSQASDHHMPNTCPMPRLAPA